LELVSGGMPWKARNKYDEPSTRINGGFSDDDMAIFFSFMQ